MSTLVKLGGTAASLGGVALSNKVLAATWKKITGNEPPATNPDPDERWRDIIIWSLVTGLVGTIIKVGISRAQVNFEAKDKYKHGGQAEV